MRISEATRILRTSATRRRGRSRRARRSDPGGVRYRRSMLFTRTKTQLPTAESALEGRDEAMQRLENHRVLGTPIVPPFPEGFETIVAGMGCFWGAEKLYWQAPGVYTTAAGYAGGFTKNPTYDEVCSGRTGHAEVVLAVFDPSKT